MNILILYLPKIKDLLKAIIVTAIFYGFQKIF